MIKCAEPACPFPARARGLCWPHYRAARKVPSSDPKAAYGKGENDGACMVPGCERPAYVRALCGSHYDWWRKTGQVVESVSAVRVSERIWGKVVRGDPAACWAWIGTVSGGGYGYYNGRIAHRLIYELATGTPLGEGIQVDHECHNEAVRAGFCVAGECAHRRCCNPAHLIARTPQEHADASPNWGVRKCT
jgi:hypothetical protein